MARIYQNAHAWVDAEPQESGAVRFRARKRDLLDSMIRYPSSYMFPSQWYGWANPLWLPWRWRSYENACRRAIACADAYARKQEQAAFGLQTARRAIADIQNHADAMVAVDALLESSDG